MVRMTPTLDNSFSLEAVTRLRAEGFAHVRHHNAMVLNIATGIEALDAALRLSITERSVDESQSLVTAARRLSMLLAGSAGDE